MNHKQYWIGHLVLVLCCIVGTAFSCNAGDEPYARRAYRLGSTISEIAATDYPDEKDWPGAKLFFSSDQTYVWATDDWLPLADIRAAMHACWKENEYNVWVPIKEIQQILPFKFTAGELEGSPDPYRIDKKHRINKVKEKDLEKYADVLQYHHPPQADLPSTTFHGKWAEAGVIKGTFYYPRVDRKRRVDRKPWVNFSSAGLWLGDQWNTTTLYFYQPVSSDEPVLFYIKTIGRSDGYDRIKALFAKAHGAPTSVSGEAVQSRLGAVYQNETVEYRNAESSVVLNRYDDDLDAGSLIHIHWPTYNELKAKLDKADDKAALNL